VDGIERRQVDVRAATEDVESVEHVELERVPLREARLEVDTDHIPAGVVVAHRCPAFATEQVKQSGPPPA
jgi:hypothetical protein